VTSGMFLSLALAARARVHVAVSDYEQAATDAYEGLAIAAPIAGYLCVPDFRESLAASASDAGNPNRAFASSARRLPSDRAVGCHASRFMTTTTIRW
jgi:hypothetical protein